jgi:uncharacterized protein Yka (UPF0111/DUF47 family)
MIFLLRSELDQIMSTPTLISRILPFAGRSRPANPFVLEFQKIAANAVLAHEQLVPALRGAPDDALARIVEFEHSADDSVREIHRLVDKTFITPYDKRDIVKLAHQLDRVVDTAQGVARILASYRALQADGADSLAATAIEMCNVTMTSVVCLKQVVDKMPVFDHDGLREAARTIISIEKKCDLLFANAISQLFPDPNQPLTAAKLAWRDVYQMIEKSSDYCTHAIGDMISIARQEGH